MIEFTQPRNRPFDPPCNLFCKYMNFPVRGCLLACPPGEEVELAPAAAATALLAVITERDGVGLVQIVEYNYNCNSFRSKMTINLLLNATKI